MEAIKELAMCSEVHRNYIITNHEQWYKGVFCWNTIAYEGLKKLSPTELVEALNKEASNG